MRTAGAAARAPARAAVPGLALVLAACLALAGSPEVTAAEPRARRDGAGPIAFGARLLDYPMQCTGEAGCRIDCFQNGNAVANRSGIRPGDEIRLVVATTQDDDVAQRWVEIRPAGSGAVQTLLLTADTFCDLKAIVIAPQRRP